MPRAKKPRNNASLAAVPPSQGGAKSIKRKLDENDVQVTPQNRALQMNQTNSNETNETNAELVQVLGELFELNGLLATIRTGTPQIILSSKEVEVSVLEDRSLRLVSKTSDRNS